MLLKSKLKKLLRSDSSRNVFILFSGFSAAQLIPLLATVVLTRVFTKEEFGTFFIYSSLCVILSALATLKLELAIVLPKNDSDSSTLFKTSILAVLIISLGIFISVYMFYSPITRLLGNKNIGELLYYIPISLFFLGITQSATYWLNRNNKFKSISAFNVSRAAVTSFLQIAFGFLAFTQYGLIVGLISGQIVAAIIGLVQSYKIKNVNNSQFTFSNIKKLLTEYRSIPIFNTSIAISNTLSNHIPILLLTSFYSLEMTAIYGLAHRIVAKPLGLVSQSIGQVLYNEASKKNNNNSELKPLVLHTYKKMFKLAFIPALAFALLAPFIFKIAFGEEWRIAGTFTQILIPWLFLMFLNSPMTNMFTILNKQKQLFIYDILLLGARVIALFIGFKIFESVYYSIALFSLAGVLFNIFLLFYILKITKQ